MTLVISNRTEIAIKDLSDAIELLDRRTHQWPWKWLTKSKLHEDVDLVVVNMMDMQDEIMRDLHMEEQTIR